MAPRIVTIVAAIASVGMLSGTPAWSQTTNTKITLQTSPTRPEVKLAAQYEALAGSQRNADSLIAGLRDGKNVLLITNPTGPNPTASSVTFTPATGKLGYGNINIALSLAKADLARQGITNPTPAQLAAALNGGTITTANGATVVMAGILAQRKTGLGWGQIANAMGVTLGSLVSQSKTDKAGKMAEPASRSGNLRKTSLSGKSGSADANGNRGGGSNGTRSGNGSGGGGQGSSGGGGSGGGRGK